MKGCRTLSGKSRPRSQHKQQQPGQQQHKLRHNSKRQRQFNAVVDSPVNLLLLLLLLFISMILGTIFLHHLKTMTMPSPSPSFLDHQEATTSDAPMEPAAPSTAGIFFKNSTTGVHTFNSFTPTHPDPSSFSIPNPFTLCSSSKGLLLCFDSSFGAYHIFNPFVHHAGSHGHIAVLSVDNHLPTALTIICAFKEAKSKYTFDWYSSRTNQWNQETTPLNIFPGRILKHTGIPNDSGVTFWLVDDERMFITFDAVNGWSQRLYLPLKIQLSSTMQLGKISGTNIGLVLSRGSLVEVYILENEGNKWESYRQLDLKKAGCIEITKPLSKVSWPSLIRFDRDVVILIGHRCLLWKINSGDARFCELYHWEQTPQSESIDTVPYMFFDMTPDRFAIEEQSIVEEEEEEEEEDRINNRALKRMRIED